MDEQLTPKEETNARPLNRNTPSLNRKEQNAATATIAILQKRQLSDQKEGFPTGLSSPDLRMLTAATTWQCDLSKGNCLTAVFSTKLLFDSWFPERISQHGELVKPDHLIRAAQAQRESGVEFCSGNPNR